MKLRWRLLSVFVLAFVLIAGSAYGQQIFQMQAQNTKIEVLSPAVFEARFGDNKHIPRTEKAILALAQELYPSQAFKQAVQTPPEEIAEDCGEEDLGVLFAALQNPAVSDATRMLVDDIIAAALPVFPKNKLSLSGHFKIYYTTNDANALNNVTDAQIVTLAAHLDSWWTKYATNFKEPKNILVGGVKRIDVYVYYISANILGQTGSGLNYIDLNSALCVKDACKRATTSAHELFHRVQYAYGYISGTANMKWIVEGTASWSQKYTNESYRDYMGRMNSGLLSPNLNLITTRAYDACHFWVFLQERADFTAIKQVWAKYQVNGKNAKTAVGSITTARLGLNFDQYATKWSKANYIKDLTNAATGGYNYLENAVTKTSCGVVYGPLKKVPVTAGAITTTSSFTQAGSVLPYGAKYHVFTVGSTVKDLAMTFKGTGTFSVAFIGMKSNAWKAIDNTTLTTYNYKKTLAAGAWDKLAVVVMGTTTGGNYTLKVGACIAGTWTDSWGYTWNLTETGSTIKGNVVTPDCGGNYTVNGTYNAPNITLTVTNPGTTTCCNSFTYTGTVTNCASASGTWTNTCGGSGSFSMTKNNANAAMLEPVDNFPVDGPSPSSR